MSWLPAAGSADWNLDPALQPHPLAAKEPRKGRRMSLAADIDTPQGPLRVYCCHLEVHGRNGVLRVVALPVDGAVLIRAALMFQLRASAERDAFHCFCTLMASVSQKNLHNSSWWRASS